MNGIPEKYSTPGNEEHITTNDQKDEQKIDSKPNQFQIEQQLISLLCRIKELQLELAQTKEEKMYDKRQERNLNQHLEIMRLQLQEKNNRILELLMVERHVEYIQNKLNETMRQNIEAEIQVKTITEERNKAISEVSDWKFKHQMIMKDVDYLKGRQSECEKQFKELDSQILKLQNQLHHSVPYLCKFSVKRIYRWSREESTIGILNFKSSIIQMPNNSIYSNVMEIVGEKKRNMYTKDTITSISSTSDHDFVIHFRDQASENYERAKSQYVVRTLTRYLEIR